MGAAIAWAPETAVDRFAATRAAFERLLRVAGTHRDCGRLAK